MDKLAKFLDFDKVQDLENWIIDYAYNYPLKIEDDIVYSLIDQKEWIFTILFVNILDILDNYTLYHSDLNSLQMSTILNNR